MNFKSNKVLIVIPPIHLLGGVAIHYWGLKNFWSGDVEYYQAYKAIRGTNKVFRLLYSTLDLVKFSFFILLNSPKKVVFNLSLRKGFFARYFYMRVAKMFGKRIVVFIHGWDENSEHMLTKPRGKWIMQNSDGMIVLAQHFKNKLVKYGFKNSILLTTTKVDDALVEGFDAATGRDYSKKNILFLARIEKAKGVYEVVDAYALLKPRYKDLTLTFVGDGSELPALKKYVEEKGLQDVRFTGRINGNALANEYKTANFFFFPSHSEGMPAVVLESMAFGLPVFTRKVGGLVDFFENGKMGYISNSLDPKDFAEAMVPYLNDQDLTRKVSLYNAKYAKEHFMGSSVAQQLENYFKTI